MDHEQKLSGELMEAIEACRPGSDDDDLPEVASILGRESSLRVAEFRRSIERIDRAVTAATQHVPVPEGLAERILTVLRVPSAESFGQPGAAATSADAIEVALPPHMVVGARRWRRWTAAIAGLAMAASLLIGLFLWTSRERVDLVDAQAQARAFYEADDHRATLSGEELPASLPVAANLVAGVRGVTLFGRTGQAYELVTRLRLKGTVKGTLYVAPLRSLWGPTLTGLPTAPVPLSTSGMTVAVWTSGRDVYVMVVQGDPQAFASFFSQKIA